MIDDAGSTGEPLYHLRQRRRTEPAVFRYRIIAVCWPDEVGRLATVLYDAGRYELDLLERSPMDQILKEMGITSQFTRGEILDQAEGRPGWAVSLGALLLESSQFASLLDGKALLGEVGAYFQRSGADLDDTEALATIAALGSVSEKELGRLASTLGLSTTKLPGSITRAATAGVGDVASLYSPEAQKSLRFYQLRPPTLADALVTERAFVAMVPTLDLSVLADDWPDHLLRPTESAIDAARLGATLDTAQRADVRTRRILKLWARPHLVRLLIVEEPTFPGCLVSARVIAIYEMTDEHSPDAKVLGVPAGDRLYGQLQGPDDFPSYHRETIQHFFQEYKALELGKTVHARMPRQPETLLSPKPAR